MPGAAGGSAPAPPAADGLAAAHRTRDYPFEPFRGDLPAELLRMVQVEPVSRARLPDGRTIWLVVGYEEVCAVLSDPRFTRRPHPELAVERLPEPRDLNMDGPGHAALRRFAGRAFTARRIETYRPRVQQITDELLDAMVAGGPPADLVGALIAPLPVLVICEVLGVPVADRDRFYDWIAGLNSVTAYGSAVAESSRRELSAYLAGQLAAKRRSPGEDLLSTWLAARADQLLTDDEVVELAIGVLLGGLEINSTSSGLRALFRHPDQLALLRAEPVRLPGAVDEILRYTTVSSMFRVQTAAEDAVLAGIRIRAGDPVMAVPWAANRDPRVFPDPHVFDIGRSPNPHLGFGYGPHFCLGAALGRLQIEVSLDTLLRRFPALAPAIPLDELPWRHDRVNGGIARFPVTW